MNIIIGAAMFVFGYVFSLCFAAMGEKKGLMIPSIIGCALSMLIVLLGIFIGGCE